MTNKVAYMLANVQDLQNKNPSLSHPPLIKKLKSKQKV